MANIQTSLKFYENDKGIEFESFYRDIKRNIKRFKELGIDVSYEEARIKEIKEECHNSALTLAETSEEQIINRLEEAYQKGIQKLNEIARRLSKYELYYESYKSICQVQRDINHGNSRESVNSPYSFTIIDLLKTINSIDTCFYESKRNAIEKIYGVVYGIIQTELFNSGYSRVLDWIKTDAIAASFISSCIEKDIEAMPSSDIIEDMIKNILNNSKGTKLKESYLQEELILFLALNDPKRKGKITSALFDMTKDVFDSDDLVDSQRTSINELTERIDKLTQLLKRSSIYKQVGIIISILALLVATKIGIDKTAKKIGHKEYRTYAEYANSINSQPIKVYPEYMKKISGWEKIVLKKYTPWNQTMFGTYTREIHEQDITDWDLWQESYKSSFWEGNNFNSMCYFAHQSNPTVETMESIEPSELYSRAILEIAHLTQDKDDTIFVPDDSAQEIYTIILTTLALVLGGLGTAIEITSIMRTLNENNSYKKLEEEQRRELEIFLISYKKLCDENAEFRNRFIVMYEKVSKYLNNANLEEKYQAIIKMDPVNGQDNKHNNN